MKKIHIYGRHGNRTPFAYAEYRQLFIRHFEYVDKPEQADYMVAGFNIDFRDNAPEIQRLINANPALQLVVFSEEPLWDTLHSGDFQNLKTAVKANVGEHEYMLNYHVVNHVTSHVYDFEHVPYFITTSNDYYVRYANMFARNIKLSSDDFVKNWQAARTRYAFYAARRVGANFDVQYQNGAIIGLNAYRSLIADGIQGDSVLREGEGWGSAIRRQALADWHLDKLAALDRQSCVVSALENTHLSSYVSEKLFDAFAVQAIPLYYAHPDHRVFRLVENGSFVNLARLSLERALDRINSFVWDEAFIERYRATQAQLAKLFANPTKYISERKRVVSETVAAFSKMESF